MAKKKIQKNAEKYKENKAYQLSHHPETARVNIF